MKKELLDKPGAEAGWAQLRLTFDEDDQPPKPGEDFRLAIQEMPSEIYFQPAGPDFWPQGGPECYAPPHAQTFDGRTLTLELGPSVTGTFRAQLYAFHIQGSQGFHFTFRTALGSLRRSAPGKTDLAVGAGSAPTLPPQEPAEPAEPEPEVSDTAALDPADPEPEAAVDLTPPPRRWMRPVLAIVLALLILGLAGLGWWLWKRPEKHDASPDSAAPAVNGLAEQDPAKTPDPTSGIPPLEEVRELLQRNAGTAELEAALTRLDQRPGAEDAVFLLAKTLAPRSPEHRVRYAAFMDPTDTRPTGSIKKNPLAAYEEYKSARAAGVPEATAALDRLRQWAEENAEKDEPGAARLWQKYRGEMP